MIKYMFSVALLFVIAPLLTSFIKVMKMKMLFKSPQPLVQGYRNLLKLLKKEIIISKETSIITKTAPFMVIAPLVALVFFLPPFLSGAFYVTFVDAFTLTGFIALSTFFLMILGLDSASSFGGMGSSREAFISALVEPAMILTIFSVSLIAGNLGISEAARNLAYHIPKESMASYIFAGISFYILLIAENGRIPVDNPETHLELTMVHEAMILDISGFYLALIEYASSLKFVIFGTLFITLFFPTSENYSVIAQLIIFIVKLFLLAGSIAVIELNTAKLRLFKVPNLLGTAVVFAFLSLISFYIMGA